MKSKSTIEFYSRFWSDKKAFSFLRPTDDLVRRSKIETKRKLVFVIDTYTEKTQPIHQIAVDKRGRKRIEG